MSFFSAVVQQGLLLVETPVVLEACLASVVWCGVYRLSHHALFAASRLVFARSELLDGPHEKYNGTPLRRVATCRVIALVHAVASISWSAWVLFAAWPTLRVFPGLTTTRLRGPMVRYDLPTTPDQRGFMYHSLGYFLQDALHMVFHEPDLIFFAHHLLYLANVFPMALAGQGWAMVACATVLAEVTNPLQLAWEMSKAFGRTKLYRTLSPPFTYTFTLVRGVLMPLCLLDMTVYVLNSERRHAVLVYSCCLMLLGTCASLAWLTQLLRGYLRYRGRHPQSSSSKEKKGV